MSSTRYRAITKIGNSVGTIIPKSFAEALKLQARDKVAVTLDTETQAITIRPLNTNSPTHTALQQQQVNPEVIAWTNRFIDENRELLERLA